MCVSYTSVLVLAKKYLPMYHKHISYTFLHARKSNFRYQKYVLTNVVANCVFNGEFACLFLGTPANYFDGVRNVFISPVYNTHARDQKCIGQRDKTNLKQTKR